MNDRIKRIHKLAYECAKGHWDQATAEDRESAGEWIPMVGDIALVDGVLDGLSADEWDAFFLAFSDECAEFVAVAELEDM